MIYRGRLVRNILVLVLSLFVAASFCFAISLGSARAEDGSTENQTGVAIGDATYETLAEAMEAAGDGDTLKLLADAAIDSPITISKGLTIDLNGNTIEVAFDNLDGTAIRTSKSMTVKNGTFESIDECGRCLDVTGELNAENVTFRDFASSGKGGAIDADKATLNIKDCTFKYNISEDSGGAVNANNSNVNITGTTFIGNEARGVSVVNDGGGALHFEASSDADVKATIDGCEFRGNSAITYGGAVVIDMYVNADILNSTFTENEVHMGGGAIMCRQPGKVLIEGNTIDSNKAKYVAHSWTDVGYHDVVLANGSTTQSPSYKAGYGGGLWLAAVNYSDLGIYDYTSDITLRKNNITKNYASGSGGGLMLVDNAVSGNNAERLDKRMKSSWIHLESGLIEGNEANIGGGIDYTTHYQRPLLLKNTLITGNSAVRGGGIWLCPQGSVESYSTLGGIISGNTASGEMKPRNMPAEILAAHGNDIASEGSDSEDIRQINGEPARFVKISDRGFGGQMINWYQDEAFCDEKGKPVDMRYSDNHKILVKDIAGYPDVFGGTNLSFATHGELAGGTIADAEKHADLIIRGNIARTRGGGIAANSAIHMGIEDVTKEISVEKKWSDPEEKLESIEVELLRLDGSEEVVIEKKTLTESDEWKHTFKNLPAEFEYTVREIIPEGWKCETKEETAEGGAKVVTLTNSKIPEEPEEPTPEKTNVTVVKKWADPESKLDEVTVNLFRVEKDGSETQIGELKLSDANEWKGEFKDLDKEFEYTVKEVIPEGFECTTEYNTLEDGTKEFTLTNTKKPEEPEKPEEPTPEEPTTTEITDEPEQPNEQPEEETTTEINDEPKQPNNPPETTTTQESSTQISESPAPRSDYGTSRTGDNQSAALAIIVLLLSAGCLTLIVGFRRDD